MAILFVALLLRLPHINDSLWFDEVWYTHLGLRGDALSFVLFHNTHPPLFALILWGWTSVFGDREITVRLPSLLCGVGSIAMTFALAQRWFGRRIACLAAVLLVLSPAHIWYSHENKNNMLLVLLTVSAVWGLDRAWASDRRGDWCAFLISSVLALWTNLFAFWITCACGLWLWIEVLRDPKKIHGLRRAVTATMVMGFAFLPVALWDVHEFDSLQLRSYLRPFTLGEVYRLLFIYLSHGNTLRTLSPYASTGALLLQPVAFFLIDAFFAGLLLSGLIWVVRHRPAGASAAAADRRMPSLLLCYFGVPLATVWLASWVYAPIYIERSMLIILPAFVILLAAGVYALPGPALRYAALTALLILNGWAFFNLTIAKADIWTVYKPKNDWRAATAYLAAELQTSGAPLMIFATVPLTVMVYYDGRFAELHDTDETGRPGAQALIKYVNAREKRSLVERLRRRHAEVCYLVEDRYWESGFNNLLAAVKSDPKFQALTERSFFGINVFKFRFARPE